MEIKRVGSRPSQKGPAEWFTGTVRIDALFELPTSVRALGASAEPSTSMTHIAIHEALDGKAVDWLEHVIDEQYQASDG